MLGVWQYAPTVLSSCFCYNRLVFFLCVPGFALRSFVRFLTIEEVRTLPTAVLTEFVEFLTFIKIGAYVATQAFLLSPI